MRYVFVGVFVALTFSLNAQQQQNRPRTDTSKTDTSQRIQPENITDTLITDTLQKNSTGLSSEVKYSAEDSVDFSVDRNIVYLYGKGRVSYQEMELSADYIRLDQKNKILFASGLHDKYGRYRGRPIFKQGQEGAITTDSLVFNFETKKGKSFGSFTEVEGGFINAAVSKKNPYNEISFKDGVYSTCNLPHPHFGIHITKGIVTEKQIISGPAYLMIEDIPMPAALPFGFFPKTSKRASGFRFPTFGEDNSLGFYIRNAGWYLGLNDYWDAEILGSIYSKGSYQSSLATRYKKNYKYSGGFNLSFASTRFGVEGTPEYGANKDFNIQWSHTQDQAAHPGVNFGANVNFGTSGFRRNTRAEGAYNLQEATRNTVSSSISYSRTFLNNRFQFASSLRHSQDLFNKTVDLDFPTFTLGMTSFNPFENKNRTGNPRWYEKITVGYSSNGSNAINNIKEYDLFEKQTLRKLNTQVSHSIPVSMSFNILKYLQFNTGVNYSERWNFKTIRRTYLPSNDSVRTDTINGFARNYNYSVSGGFSTKLYGQFNFRKGNLVAIRHVLTPNFGFSYSPDFGAPRFGFYRTLDSIPVGGLPATSRYFRSSQYSIFEAFGGGGSRGRQASLNFSFDNNVEAKVKSRSDTTTAFKKVPILQGLTFSGSYNFEGQELYKLSTISFGGRTAFFNQKIGINFNGVLDPYRVDSLGRHTAYLIRSGGGLARLASFSFSTGFNFNSIALQKRQESLSQQQNNPRLNQQQQQQISEILRNPNAFVDFNVPWNISANYSFYYTNDGRRSSVTNNLNFNGDLSVTPKWKVVYSSGYDFKARQFVSTQFSIFRDLHCWDMSFSWVPFGAYKSYSFDIRVRASLLQDLKLSKRGYGNQLNL